MLCIGWFLLHGLAYSVLCKVGLSLLCVVVNDLARGQIEGYLVLVQAMILSMWDLYSIWMT